MATRPTMGCNNIDEPLTTSSDHKLKAPTGKVMIENLWLGLPQRNRKSLIQAYRLADQTETENYQWGSTYKWVHPR